MWAHYTAHFLDALILWILELRSRAVRPEAFPWISIKNTAKSYQMHKVSNFLFLSFFLSFSSKIVSQKVTASSFHKQIIDFIGHGY